MNNAYDVILHNESSFIITSVKYTKEMSLFEKPTI